MNFTKDHFQFADAASRNHDVRVFGTGQIVTACIVLCLCVCVCIGSCVKSTSHNAGYKMKVLKTFASESDENIEEDFFDDIKQQSACMQFF